MTVKAYNSEQLATLILCAVFMLSFCCFGAPYGPEGKDALYRQPDGSTVNVKVFGDEYYAVAETTEGYVVVFDDNKVLRYAKLAADGKTFIPTGNRADNKPNDRALNAMGIGKHIRLSPSGRREAVERRLKKMMIDRKGRVVGPKQSLSTSKEDTKSGESSTDPEGPLFAPPSQTRVGDYVGLCLLVDFSDQAGEIPRSNVDDYCNKPGYTGYSNACSIFDYFQIQSDGKLRYNNIVTAYVRVPKPKSYYDNNVDEGWGNSTAQEMVADALDVLIAQGFDFTRLSTRSNGRIYAINVFYAGTCASGWSTGLWPHRWAIPQKTVDAANGIYAYDYQMTDMKSALRIGTFCHENGHMLMGYPDLYSYNGNAARVSNFSLMASSGSTHPVNVDPYLKMHSGWADIIDISSTSNLLCTVQQGRNYFYRYTNPSNPQEYFLFEARGNSTYEGPWGGAGGSVNPTSGLVAYHALETGSNTYSTIFTANNPNCDYTTPYELLVLEANPAYAGNPWYDDPTPGSNDGFTAAGKNALSDSTTPALKFWSASGRTVTSNADIHSVSAPGATMNFVIGTLPGGPSTAVTATQFDPRANFGTDAPSQTFSVFNAGGGTLNYSISDNATWLACTPASGSLTTTADLITVNYSNVAAGLAPGTHTATITVDGGAAGTKTIAVSLTVLAQATILAEPALLDIVGTSGLSGPSADIDLSNSGGGLLTYTLAASDTWMTLSRTTGTVLAETDFITVDFNATALTAGVYNGSITITAPGATNSPYTIPVTYTVQSTDMIVTGPNGGEVWQADTIQPITWASGLGGNVTIELLKGGAFDSNIASTTNNGSFNWTIPANTIPGTDYSIRITSVEQPTKTDTSNADFTIVNPIYYASMDTDPGWALGTSWAYGQPTGAGQDGYGNPDPSAGYNGNNVIGYRLDGDYEGGIAATRWATTPVIDCSNYANIKLSFQRWLGVESPTYDHAYVEVYDGTAWNQVWTNTATVDDGAWTYCEYDISVYADGKPVVQVRWGMGTTDASWNYCGWNLDEVMLTGDLTAPLHGVTITESDNSTDVTEGGTTDSYTVLLDTQPTADVTITLSPDVELSVNPTSLTFTDANWNSPQLITVTAVNDLDHELNHTGIITHSATSSDTNYDGITISDVIASITDNDNSAPTVSITPAEQTVFLSGTPAPAPVAGADIFLDAGQDPDGGTNATWEDLAPVGWDPTIDTANVTFVPDTGSSLGGITSAYDFVGGITGGTGGCEGLGLNDMAGVDGNPITLEIWFKPDTTTGHPANGQILWETGGGTGFGIFYRDGFVETAHDSNAGQISTDVTALVGEFIQVVVTFDTASSTNNFKLYINGALKATGSRGDTDLCGGDDSGLGERGQSNAGGAGSGDSLTESFDGKIAIFRSYHNQILTETEVLQNYQSVAGTGISATATVNGTVIDADLDPTTKSWTKDSGPDIVDFSTPTAESTDATFYTEGTYVLRLTAGDTMETGTNTCIVYVNPVVSTFEVLYDGNGNDGGTVPVDGNSPYDPDATVTVLGNVNGLSRTGYTYSDWNTAADGSGTPRAASDTFIITANTTLYAQWSGNTYAVTFDKQSGTGGSNSVTATYGSPMPAAAAPTRSGYLFGGYYTGTNGTGTQYYTNTMASATDWDITSPTTLYAKWAAVYTVTFQTDGTAGASLTGNASQTVTTGSSCTAVTANAPAGYHFVNWTKAAVTYSTDNPLTVSNVTEDMTLVANFIKDPTITIADDGLISEESEDGEVITVTLADGVFAAPITAANWTISDQPAGVTKSSVTRVSDTSVQITLSGNRTVDYDSDNTNMSVSCTAVEISTAIGPVSANSGVTFSATNDIESIEIVDDGWIQEAAEDGELITVILSGGTFASSLNGSNWTVENLPTDVTKGAVTRVSDIVATIALSGNRTGTYGGSDITNVTVTCTAAEYADNSGDGALSDNNGVTLRALVGGMIVLQDGLNGYLGTRDTYIDVESPGTNYGTTSPLLLSNRTSPARDKHGLLYFDLSAVPELTPSTIITGVTLELTDNGGTAGSLGVYEAMSTWGETTATYTNSSGLLGATAYATANAPGTANSAVTMVLDTNGVNLVKSWVNDSANNHGFSLISALTGNSQISQLRTREYGTPAYRPKLTINYLGGGTAPEVTVKGQGITINSGDTTPTPADDTAFGTVVQGAPVTHTFTIINHGDADLSLTGVSSDNADFSVTQPASGTVAAGGSVTFTVAFDPSIPNGQTATISIASNDTDEGTYTFLVSADGETGGGTPIVGVNLPAGISLYGYTGESPIDTQTAFQTLITNSQLSLVRWVNPLNGNIKELYYTTFPSAGWVNEIGDMTLGQGYVVKTNVACTLSISGNKSTASVVYDLPSGYSIIGFNKETPMDAQTAFQPLIDAGKLDLIRWVNPSNGAIKELYYTTFPSAGWVNEIGNLTEGQGYIIKLNAAHNGFSLP